MAFSRCSHSSSSTILKLEDLGQDPGLLTRVPMKRLLVTVPGLRPVQPENLPGELSGGYGCWGTPLRVDCSTHKSTKARSTAYLSVDVKSPSASTVSTCSASADPAAAVNGAGHRSFRRYARADVTQRIPSQGLVVRHVIIFG